MNSRLLLLLFSFAFSPTLTNAQLKIQNAKDQTNNLFLNEVNELKITFNSLPKEANITNIVFNNFPLRGSWEAIQDKLKSLCNCEVTLDTSNYKVFKTSYELNTPILSSREINLTFKPNLEFTNSIPTSIEFIDSDGGSYSGNLELKKLGPPIPIHIFAAQNSYLIGGDTNEFTIYGIPQADLSLDSAKILLAIPFWDEPTKQRLGQMDNSQLVKVKIDNFKSNSIKFDSIDNNHGGVNSPIDQDGYLKYLKIKGTLHGDVTKNAPLIINLSNQLAFGAEGIERIKVKIYDTKNYADTEFEIPILKSNISENNHKVGIGMLPTGEAKLQVNGNAAIKGNVKVEKSLQVIRGVKADSLLVGSSIIREVVDSLPGYSDVVIEGNTGGKLRVNYVSGEPAHNKKKTALEWDIWGDLKANHSLEVGDTLNRQKENIISLGEYSVDNNSISTSIPIRSDLKVRFVKIMKDGWLALPEVKVYKSGENIAFKKNVKQSSTYDKHTKAENAVDGKVCSDHRSNCLAISGFKDQNDAWWQLDLGGYKEIDSIVVFGRKGDSDDQTKNFKLLIGVEPPKVATPTLEINGNAKVHGEIKDYGGYVMPKGGIIMWSGSNIPEGWALCDGSLGTPDLRGRFIVGASVSNLTHNDNDSLNTIYGLNETGGENMHKLAIDEMPEHTHEVTLKEKWVNSGKSWDNGSGRHVICADNNSQQYPKGITNAVGGSKPHENRPPYYALAFIMKL